MSKEPKDKEATEESAAAKKPKAESKEKGATKKASAETKTKSTKASETGEKKAKKGGTPVKRAPLAPRTYFVKEGEVTPGWRIVDAANQPLGRVSTVIATILMGKNKATYTRSMNMADHVIVVNAEKIVLTGKKWEQKEYNYHTQFPGGIKTFTATELLEKHPKRLLEWSVYGMLPKGHMGRKWYKKLWVYVGPEHPHKAQQPQPVALPQGRI